MAAVRSALPPLLGLRELIKLYGLSAKAELGQNFLLDLNVTGATNRRKKL